VRKGPSELIVLTTVDPLCSSGPSQTYPQRAYRNPLDRLVAFLDAKHGDNWAIWEFRGEGTGYPDEAVYGRIRHYPWPDHHPPPFRLVPMIMASMRNWLEGGDLHGRRVDGAAEAKAAAEAEETDEVGKNGRVVVVHCKAGKGRSGTMACSYLISECGWSPEDALARFTERRMRPKFGAGVSIPSQLRWISYVDRWQKGGKKFVDRGVEIVELHVWGLRHGVKVEVEGYVDEGKKIRVFHTFKASERFVVEGDAPGGKGMVDMFSDMASGIRSPTEEEGSGEILEDADYGKITGEDGAEGEAATGEEARRNSSPGPAQTRSDSKKLKNPKTTSLMRRLSRSTSRSRSKDAKGGGDAKLGAKSKTIGPSGVSASSPSLISPDRDGRTQSQASLPRTNTFAAQDEPGGQAVIFKPEEPIVIPNGDVNISIERRNKTPTSMGLTMVTAVAHVWFNVFFEGRGPEQDGEADDSGVFEIDWDRMDGIKGSSQKGTRAADRIAVVWRVAGSADVPGAGRGAAAATAAAASAVPDVEISEPAEGEAVPQMQAADWKGGNEEDPDAEKRLGLRTEDPDSAGVSKASSIKSQENGEEGKDKEEADDAESLKGVKTSGPGGEALEDDDSGGVRSGGKKRQGSIEPEIADKTAKNGFIVE